MVGGLYVNAVVEAFAGDFVIGLEDVVGFLDGVFRVAPVVAVNGQVFDSDYMAVLVSRRPSRHFHDIDGTGRSCGTRCDGGIGRQDHVEGVVHRSQAMC